MKARPLAAVLGAALLGAGLAWWLLVPDDPAPSAARTAEARPSAKGARATAPGKDTPRTADARGTPQDGARPASAPRADRPPPPTFPDGRPAPDPLTRHAEIEGLAWVDMAEKLHQGGHPDLAQRAGAMARSLEQVAHGNAELDPMALMVEERKLLQDLRQSPMFPVIETAIGPIENGLNAAQQNGIHPADIPPPPTKDKGSQTGATPDTGLQ